MVHMTNPMFLCCGVVPELVTTQLLHQAATKASKLKWGTSWFAATSHQCSQRTRLSRAQLWPSHLSELPWLHDCQKQPNPGPSTDCQRIITRV